MFKTEILYSILLIAILILIMVYYKTSVNSLFLKALNMLNISTFDDDQEVEKVESIDNEENMDNKVNTDNFFDTEYQVTEGANDAISNALKNI
jgi:uncharacterized membrane protein YfhO